MEIAKTRRVSIYRFVVLTRVALALYISLYSVVFEGLLWYSVGSKQERDETLISIFLLIQCTSLTL
jgi:hypothetical protein